MIKKQSSFRYVPGWVFCGTSSQLTDLCLKTYFANWAINQEDNCKLELSSPADVQLMMLSHADSPSAAGAPSTTATPSGPKWLKSKTGTFNLVIKIPQPAHGRGQLLWTAFSEFPSPVASTLWHQKQSWGGALMRLSVGGSAGGRMPVWPQLGTDSAATSKSDR